MTDDAVASGSAALTSGSAALTRACCACGRFKSTQFFPVVMDDATGNSYKVDERPCKLPIDGIVFARSPFMCKVCRKENERRSEWLPCALCGIRLTISELKYSASKIQGVNHLGRSKCLIFDGELKSGRCCAPCYTRNFKCLSDDRRKVANKLRIEEVRSLRSLLELASPSTSEPPAKRPCVSPVDAPPATVAPVSLPLSSSSSSPSPIQNASRPPSPSGAAAIETASVEDAVQNLIGIQKARSETDAMIRVVSAFLSRRDEMRELITSRVSSPSAAANGSSAKPDFNGGEFVTAVECFLEMLAAQMNTIEADQCFYVQQLMKSSSAIYPPRSKQ